MVKKLLAVLLVVAMGAFVLTGVLGSKPGRR